MRINARLDEKTEKELTYIRELTGESVTDAIKYSLSLYSDRLKSSQGKKMRELLDSDFIGCSEGPRDLSGNYKNYLHQALTDKHGID